MVDVSDSKSDGGDTVWVQVPPQAPLMNLVEFCFNLLININSRNRIDFFSFCIIIFTRVGWLNMGFLEIFGIVYGMSALGSVLGLAMINDDIKKKLKDDNLYTKDFITFSPFKSILISVTPVLNFALSLVLALDFNEFSNRIYDDVYNEMIVKKIAERKEIERKLKNAEKVINDATQRLEEKGFGFNVSVSKNGRIEFHVNTSNLSNEEVNQFIENVKGDSEEVSRPKSIDFNGEDINHKIDELVAFALQESEKSNKNDMTNGKVSSHSKSLTLRRNFSSNKKNKEE